MRKGSSIIILFFVILLLVFVGLYRESQKTKETTIIHTPTSASKTVPTSTQAPFIFTTYTAPKIKKKQVYTIAMIGDSMTVSLGPHGGGFSEYINALYKNNETDPQRIIIDNYAKSSNILAVNDQLSKKRTISEYTFGPLLSEEYDLILVESYGYNPLSQYGVEDGIKKQNEELDKLMTKLITSRPHAAIVFVATIAPNVQNFAKMTQTKIPETQRRAQAEERIAYLKNHIEYAKKHNIPLVNIYEKSLTPTGEGNMEYIDPSDDIHPSAIGVIFIGRELGDFIYSQQILPK